MTKPTALPALPTTKLEKIVHLLDHWDDIHNPPLSSSQPGRRGGGGSALLPLMAGDRSVRELVRCLGVLKVDAPTQYAHLMAHHTAEWRIRVDEARVPRKGGKSELVEVRTRERLVPRWVRAQKVVSAHRSLSAGFRGPVDIPAELWDALTVSADEAELRRSRRRAAAQARAEAREAAAA